MLLQSGFRSTLDSPRHFQTSEGTNRNNFYVNPDHPRRPQTPLTEFQKIQILAEFQICQRTLTKTVLNGQLQPGILAFILASCTWIDCSLAKYGLIILKDGRALREHLISSYHYSGKRRIGLLAGRWQMRFCKLVSDQQ